MLERIWDASVAVKQSHWALRVRTQLFLGQNLTSILSYLTLFVICLCVSSVVPLEGLSIEQGHADPSLTDGRPSGYAVRLPAFQSVSCIICITPRAAAVTRRRVAA